MHAYSSLLKLHSNKNHDATLRCKMPHQVVIGTCTCMHACINTSIHLTYLRATLAYSYHDMHQLSWPPCQLSLTLRHVAYGFQSTYIAN